jgi:hypothetical protein
MRRSLRVPSPRTADGRHVIGGLRRREAARGMLGWRSLAGFESPAGDDRPGACFWPTAFAISSACSVRRHPSECLLVADGFRASGSATSHRPLAIPPGGPPPRRLTGPSSSTAQSVAVRIVAGAPAVRPGGELGAVVGAWLRRSPLVRGEVCPLRHATANGGGDYIPESGLAALDWGLFGCTLPRRLVRMPDSADRGRRPVRAAAYRQARSEFRCSLGCIGARLTCRSGEAIRATARPMLPRGDRALRWLVRVSRPFRRTGGPPYGAEAAEARGIAPLWHRRCPAGRQAGVEWTSSILGTPHGRVQSWYRGAAA